MARTSTCTAATKAGRRRKALQFAEAAQVIAGLADDADEVADAYVTLLIHAGIASADVLYCARLGRHSTGDNHVDAVSLLAKVDRALADDLNTLLALKTKAGYSHAPIAKRDRVRVERAGGRLVQAVRDLPSS